MRLSDWLEREGLSHADFGGRIGVSGAAIGRYVAGTRIPLKDLMIKIHTATNGEVGPADFYTLDAPPPSEASA